jgi:hypothetical protein
VTDLDQLANLAEIFGALTVIVGAGFALIQLREYRRQRRENAAAELMRSFQSPELARAIRLIRELPDACPAAELRRRGTELEEAAIIVSTTYEAIGLLVFRRVTPFPIVLELTGGLAVLMWRKLERWTSEVRLENAQPSWAEWFQWLAERLREHQGDKQRQPAYLRYASWRADRRR